MSKHASTQSSFGKLVAWHVLICEEIFRVKGAFVEKTETKTCSKIFLVVTLAEPRATLTIRLSLSKHGCPAVWTSSSRYFTISVSGASRSPIDQNDLVRLKKRVSPAVDYQKTKKEIISDLNKSEQQQRFPVNHRAQCSEIALSIHNYAVWLPW